LRPLHRTALAAGIGITLTVTVAILPAVDVAYRRPLLHILLEATCALIALLASYLLAGRFLHSGRIDDLALTIALLAFACASLVFDALPFALTAERTAFSTWAPLMTGGLGALLLASAAFAPPLRVRRPARALAIARVGLATGLLVASTAGSATRSAPSRCGPAAEAPNCRPRERDGVEPGR